MLNRNRSMKNFARQTELTENAHISLTQKDKIISMLRSELESYNTLYENISRLKEKKTTLLNKCDNVFAEIARTKELQEKRQFNDDDKIRQLSRSLEILEKEFRDKIFYLKEVRSQGTRLVYQSENRSNDYDDCCGDIESKKANMNLIQVERDRILGQIDFLKEEIAKLQNYQKKSLISIEKIRDQGLQSETYIRNLANQENKINDQITMIETDNQNASRILQELTALQQVNKNKVREQTQQNSNLALAIKKKQIEKGRKETKKADALNRLRGEQQRQRELGQQINKKKGELNSILNILKNEIKPQILDLKNQNTDSHQINSELRSDMDYCQGHLQNLTRTNKILSDQLDKIERTTANVIKLLTNVNANRKTKNISCAFLTKRESKDLGLKSRQPLSEIVPENTYRSQTKGDFYETADHLSKSKNSRII